MLLYLCCNYVTSYLQNKFVGIQRTVYSPNIKEYLLAYSVEQIIYIILLHMQEYTW